MASDGARSRFDGFYGSGQSSWPLASWTDGTDGADVGQFAGTSY